MAHVVKYKGLLKYAKFKNSKFCRSLLAVSFSLISIIFQFLLHAAYILIVFLAFVI